MLYFIVRRGIIARYRCKNTSSQSAAIFGKGWREKRRTEVGGGGKKKECNKRLIKGDMQKRGMCASWSVRSDALCWYTRELFFRRMIFTEEKATSLSSLLFFFFFYIYLFFVVILFVLFGKKRRFSFRSEDRGICIISPRTAASLVFSFFQCLLISFYLAHYTYISLSLSLFFSLTVYLLFGNTICCTSCLCCSAERGSHAM